MWNGGWPGAGGVGCMVCTGENYYKSKEENRESKWVTDKEEKKTFILRNKIAFIISYSLMQVLSH